MAIVGATPAETISKTGRSKALISPPAFWPLSTLNRVWQGNDWQRKDIFADSQPQHHQAVYGGVGVDLRDRLMTAQNFLPGFTVTKYSLWKEVCGAFLTMNGHMYKSV